MSSSVAFTLDANRAAHNSDSINSVVAHSHSVNPVSAILSDVLAPVTSVTDSSNTSNPDSPITTSTSLATVNEGYANPIPATSYDLASIPISSTYSASVPRSSDIFILALVSSPSTNIISTNLSTASRHAGPSNSVSLSLDSFVADSVNQKFFTSSSSVSGDSDLFRSIGVIPVSASLVSVSEESGIRESSNSIFFSSSTTIPTSPIALPASFIYDSLSPGNLTSVNSISIKPIPDGLFSTERDLISSVSNRSTSVGKKKNVSSNRSPVTVSFNPIYYSSRSTTPLSYETSSASSVSLYFCRSLSFIRHAGFSSLLANLFSLDSVTSNAVVLKLISRITSFDNHDSSSNHFQSPAFPCSDFHVASSPFPVSSFHRTLGLVSVEASEVSQSHCLCINGGSCLNDTSKYDSQDMCL